jgi:sec-independent protein translocase protein TatB
MEFLGISFWEFLLIVVVVIVVLGPSKIPGIMRTLGTIIRNIRRITSELTASVAREIALDDARKEAENRPSPPKDEAAKTKVPETTPPKPSRDSLPAGRSTHDEQ